MVLGPQVRQEVHHARVYGQPLTPPCSSVPGTELQPGAERLCGIFPAAQQPDGRLGHDQRDVALQPLPQALAQVGRPVLLRREIDPHLTVPDLHREHARLVGPPCAPSPRPTRPPPPPPPPTPPRRPRAAPRARRGRPPRRNRGGSG